MTCPHCSAALSDTAKFCDQCGTRIPLEGDREIALEVLCEWIGERAYSSLDKMTPTMQRDALKMIVKARELLCGKLSAADVETLAKVLLPVYRQFAHDFHDPAAGIVAHALAEAALSHVGCKLAKVRAELEQQTTSTTNLRADIAGIVSCLVRETGADVPPGAEGREAAFGRIREMRAELERERDRREQCEVQLAGCGVAALGWSKDGNEAKQGDYGWSASYDDVRKLREKYESQAAEIATLKAELAQTKQDCAVTVDTAAKVAQEAVDGARNELAGVREDFAKVKRELEEANARNADLLQTCKAAQEQAERLLSKGQ